MSEQEHATIIGTAVQKRQALRVKLHFLEMDLRLYAAAMFKTGRAIDKVEMDLDVAWRELDAVPQVDTLRSAIEEYRRISREIATLQSILGY